MLDKLAAGVDRTAHFLALHRSQRSRRRSSAESLGPAERARALRAIRDRGATEDPSFYDPPPAPRDLETRFVRRLPAGEVIDVAWSSGYVPWDAAVRDRWLARTDNATARARLFLHDDRPRPVVLLIHGYLGGAYAFEERAWPLGWLFEAGLDIALPVLPHHAQRSGGRRPAFPASDPRLTVEGFRQSMHDLRSVARWLVDRGAPAVGAMGMSLGGYTAALLATVDSNLAFVVPFIPLASIADFAKTGGRYVGTASQQREQHQLLEEVHAVVSPLARAPLVPKEGRLVVAASADRITPLGHAQRLAAHFDAPLVVFRGGHLLQLGRRAGFRAVGRMLADRGLLDPRPA